MTNTPTKARAPKIEVEVDTSYFEAAHDGKRPHGTGGWAFCFSTDGLTARHAGACDPRILWTPCGLTYGESRRLAVAEGKRRAVAAGDDFVVVEVMS